MKKYNLIGFGMVFLFIIISVKGTTYNETLYAAYTQNGGARADEVGVVFSVNSSVTLDTIYQSLYQDTAVYYELYTNASGTPESLGNWTITDNKVEPGIILNSSTKYIITANNAGASWTADYNAVPYPLDGGDIVTWHGQTGNVIFHSGDWYTDLYSNAHSFTHIVVTDITTQTPTPTADLINLTQTNSTVQLNASSSCDEKCLVYQDGVNVKNITSFPDTITGLTNNTEYSFNFTVYDSAYSTPESNFSNTITTTTTQNSPPAPNSQTPTPTADLVNLTQTNTTIRLNASNGCDEKCLIYQDGVNVVNITEFPYIVTGLTNATSYSFNFTVYNGTYDITESNFSNTITVSTLQNSAQWAKLIAEGDSLVHSGMTTVWANYLDQTPEYSCYEGGLEGQTSTDILNTYIPAEVIGQDYDIVIIQCCNNDMSDSKFVSIPTYRNNLYEMGVDVLDDGKNVTFVDLPPCNYTDRHCSVGDQAVVVERNNVIRKVTFELNQVYPGRVGYDELFDSVFGSDFNISQIPDGIHPNNETNAHQNTSIFAALSPLTAYDCVSNSSYCYNFSLQTLAPENLTTTVISDTQIDLDWDQLYAAEKYLVYKDNVNTDNTTSTNFSVTGLSNYTSYSFNVSAYDTSYNISTSNTTAAVSNLTKQSQLPASPSFKATSKDRSAIYTEWNSLSGAIKYILYKDGVNTANTTDLYYNFTGLSYATSYELNISGYNSSFQAPEGLQATTTNITGSNIAPTLYSIVPANNTGIRSGTILLNATYNDTENDTGTVVFINSSNNAALCTNSSVPVLTTVRCAVTLTGSLNWSVNASDSGNTTTYGVYNLTTSTYCGDGVYQAVNDESVSESCDGSDLNSQTCQTQGYDTGTLGCSASCTFIVTGCQSGGGGGSGTTWPDEDVPVNETTEEDVGRIIDFGIDEIMNGLLIVFIGIIAFITITQWHTIKKTFGK